MPRLLLFVRHRYLFGGKIHREGFLFPDFRSAQGYYGISSGSRCSFRILLPRTDPVEPSQPGEESALNHQNSRPARTIMVVEDEGVLRQALCKMLRKKGLLVEAGDGLTTMEVLRRQAAEIDLVLMDLTLPGLSGASLFEDLRIRRFVKVIPTSAYDAEAAAGLVTRGEHLEFVRKPYRFTDLLFRIEKTLVADCSVGAG